MPYIVQEIIEENPDLVMACAKAPRLDILTGLLVGMIEDSCG